MRGIYDNMKTAVTTVFVGKERVFNRRFLVMADHYMVEPTACSPAAGWEKDQSLPRRRPGSRTRSRRSGAASSSLGCGSPASMS